MQAYNGKSGASSSSGGGDEEDEKAKGKSSQNKGGKGSGNNWDGKDYQKMSKTVWLNKCVPLPQSILSEDWA